jgi:hypothetical protein
MVLITGDAASMVSASLILVMWSGSPVVEEVRRR